MKKSKPTQALDPKTTIGHIHLKVADLERSVKFYRDILGFEVMTRMELRFMQTGLEANGRRMQKEILKCLRSV